MIYTRILYVHTLLDMIVTQNQIVNVRSSNYKQLKKRVLSSTFAYGTSITTLYFMAYGAEEGVSAALGFATSVGYLNFLTRSVDNIEKYPVQPQLLVPIGTGIFESMWNAAPFPFDFDYGATFVGFLAYKFAVLTVVYEEVKKMLKDDTT